MSASNKVMIYLEEQANARPDLAVQYGKLSTLYQRRLWHQLTDELEQFARRTDLGEQNLVQLYQHFIREFELKLNPLTLVKLAVAIIKELKTPQEGLAFLLTMLEKVKADVGARVLVLATSGLLQLRMGDITASKESMEKAQQNMEGVAGLEAVVYTQFYKLCVELYKVQHDVEQFFESGVQYLHYVDLNQISVEEQRTMMLDLAMAAITAPAIYSFGELLGHPMSKQLQSWPQYAWLYDLLTAFNCGDIHAYKRLFEQSPAASDSVLQPHAVELRKKICILALIQLVFARPAEDRNLSFADIAAAADIPINEVEWLVMKALSLNLIKGTIDQITQVVEVSWVRPRVLDNSQICTLIDRLGQWKQTLANTLLLLENETATEFGGFQ
eukprot:TRINITY_DN17157_c0_g1_i1.p1 TRINITY_DN17157_c0_g1~~TRINITY_DN17157_c0_g1_i1.p1  ORF type:complete len:386 (-),score=133.37 TRINITY_DN17157_c0_g1_i1:45-1202(-)